MFCRLLSILNCKLYSCLTLPISDWSRRSVTLSDSTWRLSCRQLASARVHASWDAESSLRRLATIVSFYKQLRHWISEHILFELRQTRCTFHQHNVFWQHRVIQVMSPCYHHKKAQINKPGFAKPFLCFWLPLSEFINGRLNRNSQL